MASQITVTLPIGPGESAVAQVLTNVTDVDFQLDRKVLQVTAGGKITAYDFSTAATVTYTISAGNSTIVVSS